MSNNEDDYWLEIDNMELKEQLDKLRPLVPKCHCGEILSKELGSYICPWCRTEFELKEIIRNAKT